MSRASLEAAIPQGDRVLLDASTLIAYLNGGEDVTPIATHVINVWVRSGRNEALISMVSVMEILVRPLRIGAPGPYQTALDFLTHFPNLRTVPFDMHMTQEAATLRATYNFSPPDSMTIATGILTQVGHLVTNDDRWMKLQPIAQRIGVCHLASHLPFP